MRLVTPLYHISHFDGETLFQFHVLKASPRGLRTRGNFVIGPSADPAGVPLYPRN